MLIDTHAHLQMNDYDPDRDDVIKRAYESDVKCIINASFDLESSWKSVKIVDEADNLYTAVGIHPHDADSLDEDAILALWDMANHPKVIAIGETGLDYYRDLSPRHIQRKAFERQIKLALDVNLPIIVHNRDAFNDTLDILNQYKGKLRGVMHCFSGDIGFAEKCIELGFYISFAGNITYSNANMLREVAASVPDSSFFLETDCPYLTPQFKRGKRNEPAYLKAIAKKIAELRHTTFPDIARLTTKNAFELFGIVR